MRSEDVHHGGSEHVDAEEAEIVAGANAGDQQALLGFGGRGLFDHRIDAIQVAARRDAAAADGAVARQQALARGLHAADRAPFRSARAPPGAAPKASARC